MNREEITALLPELRVFLKTLRVFSLILIVSVFGSYIVALWLWSLEHTLVAFLLASLAFLIFYSIQTRLAHICCAYLAQDTRYSEMLGFVRENLGKKTSKEFVGQLEKAVAIIQTRSS